MENRECFNFNDIFENFISKFLNSRISYVRKKKNRKIGTVL